MTKAFLADPSSRLDGIGHALSRPAGWLIVGAYCLLLNLPFLDQAFVIDDGAFIDQAQQILRDPSAPYSFTINLTRPRYFFWYMANPPGLAYYLAGVVQFFGARELALHIACAIFPLMAAFAMLELARELGRNALFAAMLLVSTPAFLLSSHTVMADVPALAFTLIALACFFRGDRLRSAWLLTAAGVAAGVAALLEYAALTVFPLMALFLLLRRRFDTAQLLPFAAGALIFGSWCWISYRLYGEVHLLAAANLELGERAFPERLAQVWGALLGLGATTIFPALLLPWSVVASFRLSRAHGAAALAGAGAAALASVVFGATEKSYDSGNLLLGGLFAGTAAATLVFVLARGVEALRSYACARKRGDEEETTRAVLTLVLVVWFSGTFLLTAVVIFATPKYLIPAVVPLVLLLLEIPRRGHRSPRAARRAFAGRTTATVATACLGLALSSVSAEQAAAHRDWIERTRRELPAGHDAWFVNHWTIRYYAERAGFRYLGPGIPETPEPGDVVLAFTESVLHPIPSEILVVPWDRHEVYSRVPLRLANQEIGAGYWAHVLGPMPYLVSEAPLVTVQRFHVRRR